MSWTDPRIIPNEYNDEAKEIDNQLIGLIKQRRKLSVGKRFFPPEEYLEQWSEEFSMDIDKVRFILQNLEENRYYYLPDGPGALKSVIPMMKKTVSGECEYTLTHIMQYELGSVIKIDIKYLGENPDGVMLKMNLMLEVISEQIYQVNRNGSHGGGGYGYIEFMVVPALPDQLEGIEFSLVRSLDLFAYEPREVILNQQVDF